MCDRGQAERHVARFRFIFRGLVAGVVVRLDDPAHALQGGIEIEAVVGADAAVDAYVA